MVVLIGHIGSWRFHNVVVLLFLHYKLHWLLFGFNPDLVIGLLHDNVWSAGDYILAGSARLAAIFFQEVVEELQETSLHIWKCDPDDLVSSGFVTFWHFL